MNKNFIFDSLFDSLFYFFGLTDNPAASKVEEILKDSPSEKIKKDIAKMNSDYRRAFIDFKKSI